MSLIKDFTKLAGVDEQLDEGKRKDIERKFKNRIGHIDKGIGDLAKSQNRTNVRGMGHDKTRAKIAQAVRQIKDEDLDDVLKSLASLPKHRRGLKESEQLNEWNNKDVRFCVVLTASEASEYKDVYSEVDTAGLKNIILGSPKEEVKSIAIFPESMKAQAEELANQRLHAAESSSEEEEDGEISKEDARKHIGKAYGHGYAHHHRELYGKSHPKNPFKPDTPNYNNWEDEYRLGRDDYQYEKNGHEDEEVIPDGSKEPEYQAYLKKFEQDKQAAIEAGHKPTAKPLSYEDWTKKWYDDELIKDNIKSREAEKAHHGQRIRGHHSQMKVGGEDEETTKGGQKRETKQWDDVEITSGAYKGERGHISIDDDGKKWIVVSMNGYTRDLDADHYKHKLVKEAAGQLDELSKKTLAAYAKKAVDDATYNSFIAGNMDRGDPARLKTDKKAMKRQAGVEKAIDKLAEADEVKVAQLDDEQGDLEKQAEIKPEKEKVPAEVFQDIEALIKEIKFKVDHLSHIDPTYQEHGYGFQFMVQLQQIADMLKQGTEEAFKEAAVKLQSLENIALVQVPDSLWKFLSVDMHKPADKRKTTPLSAKFQEIKKGDRNA